MKNVALQADFLSAHFLVLLPAPNKDPSRWAYWITVGMTDRGHWAATVQHKITGMKSPATLGEFPIAEVSDTAALMLARQIAAETPPPPVKRAGRQYPEECSVEKTVWVVTLDGLDRVGNQRQADVIIKSGSMQEGLSTRPEPCTAEVRRRTVAGDATWYQVPCKGMSPQNAGEAAVSACKFIRWG